MMAARTVIGDAGTGDLTELSVTELAGLWKRHLTERVPDHLPRSQLAGLLAYRLQVEQHGGLSKKAVAYLKVMETDLREGRDVATPYVETKQLKLGTQLAREHGGVMHRVMVLEGGFAWSGKTFSSLSAVAKAITGTNWNGHRFFGLQEKAKAEEGVSA
jgi:Protein of unknown function (DUF2924)